MKLLTEELRKLLPPLYSQEKLGEDAIVYTKFFCPWNQWTWYATEFDGEDRFFGYVVGMYHEWGYFYLSDLESVSFHGLHIERDLHWTPTSWLKIKELHDVR